MSFSASNSAILLTQLESISGSELCLYSVLVHGELKHSLCAIHIIGHRLTERLTAVYSDGSLNITEPNNVIWPCKCVNCICVKKNIFVYPENLLVGVPSDGIPVIVIDSVKVWAFVASIILSIGGIVLIIICSIFIFIYRKAKLVK